MVCHLEVGEPPETSRDAATLGTCKATREYPNAGKPPETLFLLACIILIHVLIE